VTLPLVLLGACGSSHPTPLSAAPLAEQPQQFHIQKLPVSSAPLERRAPGVPRDAVVDLRLPAPTTPALSEPEVGDGTATLSWNPPTQTVDGAPFEGISRYRIDYGRDPRVLERTVEIDNPSITSYVVDNLPAGQWHFRLTAFDSEGNQSLATEVGSKTIE